MSISFVPSLASLFFSGTVLYFAAMFAAVLLLWPHSSFRRAVWSSSPATTRNARAASPSRERIASAPLKVLKGWGLTASFSRPSDDNLIFAAGFFFLLPLPTQEFYQIPGVTVESEQTRVSIFPCCSAVNAKT